MSSLLRRTWLLVVMFTCLLVVVAVARTLPDKPQRSHKTCVLKTTKKARFSRSRHRRGTLNCTRKSAAGEKSGVAPSQGGSSPSPAATPAAAGEALPAAVSPGREEGELPPEEDEVAPPEEELVPPPEEGETPPEEEVQPPEEEQEPPPEEGETPPPEEGETPPEDGEPPSSEDPGVPAGVVAQGEDFAGAPAAVLLTSQAGLSVADTEGCVGISTAGETMAFGGFDPGPGQDEVRLELVPGGSMPAQVRCPSADGAETLDVAAAAPSAGGVLPDPIDPANLTRVPFGRRSFWLQPWRSYLDTWPASRLGDGLGINFNVTATEAEATARLLASSGFRLARVEISWNQLSYDDPNEFVNEASLRKKLVALRDHGLRPLILLNANSGGPTPAKPVTLTTDAVAPAGARSVQLDQSSAAAVVPGRTGFAGLSFGGNPDLLITAVDDAGIATLSRPLPAALNAGPHAGSTLRYGPFGPPRLANGDPNPEFQRTLAGWLKYVDVVTGEATSVFGADGYDLELWNELSFGSQFLDEGNYYSPRRVEGSGSVTDALLRETVAHLRDPENGISPQVGISDGFASQTPFASGGSVPAGTTALSKHLYRGPRYFPRNDDVNTIKPLNAFGGSDSTTERAPFSPRFTPSFASALPEYFLTATQTETVVRDLAPITTSIYGTPHGRAVGPAGGSPPQTWMTEYNLNTNTLFPLSQNEPDQYIGTASAEEKEQLQAKIVLRSLVSMTAKGMSRVYFYAAAHSEGFSLISDRFIDALSASPTVYPGDQMGGYTTDAVRNLLSRFAGPGPSGPVRQLELRSIAQAGNHAEFSGDGTAAHPDLYDRDLLAVFPFQSSPSRFVIPVYVMTPNLTTVYGEPGSRFDLPDERFRITLANLPSQAQPPAVAAYDPVRDSETPARLVSRRGGEAVFEVAATNYPRLLTIDYTGG
jgi:hypothetical protein